MPFIIYTERLFISDHFYKCAYRNNLNICVSDWIFQKLSFIFDSINTSLEKSHQFLKSTLPLESCTPAGSGFSITLSLYQKPGLCFPFIMDVCPRFQFSSVQKKASDRSNRPGRVLQNYVLGLRWAHMSSPQWGQGLRLTQIFLGRSKSVRITLSLAFIWARLSKLRTPREL